MILLVSNMDHMDRVRNDIVSMTTSAQGRLKQSGGPDAILNVGPSNQKTHQNFKNIIIHFNCK
jgi:hypothetical protein